MQFLIREMAQKHVPRIFPASVCATVMEKLFVVYFGEFYAMVFFYLDFCSCPARTPPGVSSPAGSEDPEGRPILEWRPATEGRGKHDTALLSPSAGAKKCNFS